MAKSAVIGSMHKTYSVFGEGTVKLGKLGAAIHGF